MKKNRTGWKKVSAALGRNELDMKLVMPLLGVLSIITICLAVGLGPVSVPPGTTIRILLSKVPGLSGAVPVTWDTVQENIVLGLRMPRVLLGFIVGAALAVTGVAMQALVRNPLADPFILGVSSGASATASLFLVFGVFSFLGTYALSLSAFLGAAATIILVYTISRSKGRIVITQLLLAGVAVSMIMDGVTKIITLSAPNALGLHNAEFWMAGSLAGARWGYLTLPLVVMLVCLTFLMINYRTLNILLLGEEAAGTLGVNVKHMQKYLVLIASLLAGVTIAVSGSIGFVGLMCPHFARMLVGGDHKRVLPVCAMIGGILVVWTDVAARLILAPEELPIGILTAIIGGPVFIILLKKKRTH